MSSSPATAPAPSSSDGRGRFVVILREFWRGLTTPSLGVVGCVLVLLAFLVVAGSWLAHGDRVTKGSASVWIDNLEDDYARSSALAMQGAARHARGPEKTLLFVGPSSLRFWLPPPAEASRVASAAAGRPVRVLVMAGNAQSYATTVALADRFGSDFDGWIVVGVDRQTIGRELDFAERQLRCVQATWIGFESPLLRAESSALGYPLRSETGWSLWDRRSFHFHSWLGLGGWLPGLRGDYSPHWAAIAPVNLTEAADSVGPLSPETLDGNLAVLSRMAARMRTGGRARLALVETPWIDQFVRPLQTTRWREDEKVYTDRRAVWSGTERVPWLVGAESFPATPADFVDGRHLGSSTLRRRFLAVVARELCVEERP